MTGIDNSRGVCGTLRGGFFAGAEVSVDSLRLCRDDVGSRMVIAGFEFSGDVSMLRSKAGDIGQLAGYGCGGAVRRMAWSQQ